jgi:hypothetical protein
MADISITDQVSVTASVTITDASPLALANLKKLNFATVPVISDFPKPIDQCPLNEAALGLSLSTPSSLIDKEAKLSIGGGISGTFSICGPKQGKLFDDSFSPAINIPPGDCWASLSIGFSLKESVATPGSGFGVSVKATQAVALATYVRFPEPQEALPTLKDGLASVLCNYSVPATASQIRAIPVGVAHAAETSGSISFGASYSAPLTVNPLAAISAKPLNFALNIQPDVEACLAGSIELEGSFIVRAYRSAPAKLLFGVYKKRATELSASFTASAGIGADLGKTDLLAKVLDTAVPGADMDSLQLQDSEKDSLNTGLKACVDHSIALSLNACCTASQSDEAAAVYEIDLSVSDTTATDRAISAALHGDWSQLESLSNAVKVRNIVRELRQRNHNLTINLLGLYNFASLAEYVKSSTVLHDENGQISLVDVAASKDLQLENSPYAAKPDKLRNALAQAFIATIAYGAAKGKLGVTSFTVHQSFLEYHAKASACDITKQVLLSRSVGLSLNSAWDQIPKSDSTFVHDKFCLNVSYDLRSVLRLFYQDVDNRKSYPPETLDRIGRDTRIALLDPTASTSIQRRTAIGNDDIWKAMNDTGDVASFRFLPGLAKLPAPALAAISADFLDIRWWRDALQKLTPRLTALLTSIDQSKSSNPLTDAAFITAHHALENALANLTSQTHSAFGDGWPLAVMYRLAASANGAAPSVQMDIGWNENFEHYQSGGPTIAVGQTSGA